MSVEQTARFTARADDGSVYVVLEFTFRTAATEGERSTRILAVEYRLVDGEPLRYREDSGDFVVPSSGIRLTRGA